MVNDEKLEIIAEDPNDEASRFEAERGQLTAEIMEKDANLAKLEREAGSLAAALAQRDEDHSLALEEAETKFRLLQEESTKKIDEVKFQF